MKKYLPIIVSLLLALAIAFGLPRLFSSWNTEAQTVENSQSGYFNQAILEVTKEPHEVIKIYNQGNYLGVMQDSSKLDELLNKVYKESYEEEFPNTSLSLGKDTYISKEQSYYIYDNIDDQICDYFLENDLFTVKVTEVEFSDENGIYARIYVPNEEMYESAMNEYLTYFMDPLEYELLRNGQTTPELKSYGSRSVGVSIMQSITFDDTYAKKEEILRTKEEILDYIEYGNNTERYYYTTNRYDTVAGVGAKNNGLSATQVMNLNRDQISSIDQVLSEGMELCVTYFTPIVDVVVMKEALRKEAIYPTTIYTEDETLRVGVTETIQESANGSKNSLYNERWINGVLVNGTLQSSVDTLQPVNEIIAVGTLEIPGVGTGQYRWPVDNPFISCGWGCYTIPHLHEAIDLQNRYDLWGNIYAADRGVIEKNHYDGISGNYIIINHNNGQKSYYGHMSSRSPLEEGTIVDKGDFIGKLGMTGRATGPHTHFYIEIDGVKMDPCKGFLDCEAIR